MKRLAHLADLACLRLQDRKTAELVEFVSSGTRTRPDVAAPVTPTPQPAGAAVNSEERV